MRKIQQQKGFTLVELAIVITIIGLLIGGILKGQQLMQNARVLATISQVRAIETATTAFLDSYGGLPGDMSGANTKIPGWVNTTTAYTTSTNGTLGDGRIGDIAWDLTTAQGSTAVANPAVVVGNETLFFWGQLGKAGLLGGVNYDGAALTASTAAIGLNAPTARLGGTFIVGHANGAVAQPVTGAPSHPLLSGTVLVLAPDIVTALGTTSGSQVTNANTAAQIDRKIDDGNPLTGEVQAFGFAAASATSGCLNTTSPFSYNESVVTAKVCGLFFKVNG
jgi:prepilin-type N-terminal cleavage/methylation domain-containing protein